MKINAINTLSGLYQPRLQKNSKTSINTPLSNDVFIKSSNDVSTPQSFTGLTTFDRLYAKYKPEIIDFALNHPNPTIYDATELISSFCPFIDVKNFSDKMIKISPNARASYEVRYSIPDKIISGNETPEPQGALYLKFPDKEDEKGRVIFAGDLLHEIVHAMQEECSDRRSIADFALFQANKNAQFRDIIPLLGEMTVQFQGDESDMAALVCNERIQEYLNSGIDPELNALRVGFKEALRRQNQFIEKISGQTFKKNTFFEFAKYCATREIEAYTKSQLALIKQGYDIGIGKSELETRILFYKLYIEEAEKLSKELA